MRVALIRCAIELLGVRIWRLWWYESKRRRNFIRTRRSQDQKRTHLSTPKMIDPKRSGVRECLSNTRNNIRGTTSAYNTAKTMDGAKSSRKGVPPTGVGKVIPCQRTVRKRLERLEPGWGEILLKIRPFYIPLKLAATAKEVVKERWEMCLFSAASHFMFSFSFFFPSQVRCATGRHQQAWQRR